MELIFTKTIVGFMNELTANYLIHDTNLREYTIHYKGAKGMKFSKFDKQPPAPDTHILLRLQLAGATMFLGYYYYEKERFISDEGIEFTLNQLIRFEAQYLNPYLIKVEA